MVGKGRGYLLQQRGVCSRENKRRRVRERGSEGLEIRCCYWKRGEEKESPHIYLPCRIIWGPQLFIYLIQNTNLVGSRGYPALLVPLPLLLLLLVVLVVLLLVVLVVLVVLLVLMLLVLVVLLLLLLLL